MNQLSALSANVLARLQALSSQGVDVSGVAASVAALRSAAQHADLQQPQFPDANIQRPLPTGVLRPSGILSVATTLTSPLCQVQWNLGAPGYVVGIQVGTIEDTAASNGAMSVRVTRNSNDDLFSDGQAGAFGHFATLLAGSSPGLGWPCYLPFAPGDQWQLYFKNESGTGPYTPVIHFNYVLAK